MSCFMLKFYPPVACLTCHFLSLSVPPSVFSSVNHSLFTEVHVFPSLLVSSSVPGPLLMFDLCLLPIPSCFPGLYFVFCFGSLISTVFALCLLFPLFWDFIDLGFSAFFVIKAHFLFSYLSACVSCIWVPFVTQWHTLHRRRFGEWGSFLPDIVDMLRLYLQSMHRLDRRLCVSCAWPLTWLDLVGAAWCGFCQLLSEKKKENLVRFSVEPTNELLLGHFWNVLWILVKFLTSTSTSFSYTLYKVPVMQFPCPKTCRSSDLNLVPSRQTLAYLCFSCHNWLHILLLINHDPVIHLTSPGIVS